jgi:hypothetical protein
VWQLIPDLFVVLPVCDLTWSELDIISYDSRPSISRAHHDLPQYRIVRHFWHALSGSSVVAVFPQLAHVVL